MNYRIPGPYRGYNAHRGRRLKIIAALVGVCLLGASAFLLLQDYLVFSPDGVRLELPFFGLDKKSGKAPKKEETPPLKVETGGSEKNGTEPQSNAAEPEQTAPEKPAGNSDSLILNAVCADYAKLSDREYRRSLMSLSGVNAVIVDLKLADGNVTYLSKAASPDAQKKASDSVSDAIKEFSENGLRVIGRISAFRDNAAPRTVMRSSAIRTGSGATWLDYNYYGWLDPYKKSSAEYLGALSKEAEELGCSEV
ncbi:MAG: putative glycoside hydrolase, partial [Bacillota bacterium]|nr:putative glycoside hydrolase [Bacillota bacterium]